MTTLFLTEPVVPAVEAGVSNETLVTTCDDCGRPADTCRLVHGETDFVDLCRECLSPERR